MQNLSLRALGTSSDRTKTRYWFEMAAEQGHSGAQYMLALMYHGGIGGKQSFRNAYYWFIEASLQKHTEALSKLKDMVCNAEGAKEDIAKVIGFLESVSEQEVPGVKDCLDHIRNQNIAMGVAGTGVIAATVAGQDLVQDAEASSIAEDNLTEITPHPEEVDFKTEELSPDIDSISEALESASEIGAELVSEVGAGIVSEIAADLALDWIPGVGFGKLGFEAVIGIHLLTGRNLTPFERVASGGGAVLNLFGLGWFKNLKSLKHSKAVGQQANKWVSSHINGEQWAKLVRFVKEGQIERAKGYLKAFFQSIGDIGFKVKKKVKPRRKVLAGVVSSADEVSETLVVKEGFGQMRSGQLHETVDWNKWSDPRISKVFRIKEADNLPNTQRLFIRTPRGNQVLDYNNLEVLRWLREAEIPQKQSLEALIERGASKGGKLSTTVPLRETVKESVDDLASLVH